MSNNNVCFGYDGIYAFITIDGVELAEGMSMEFDVMGNHEAIWKREFTPLTRVNELI